MRTTTYLAALAVSALLVTSAQAAVDINGYKAGERIFNDDSGSTLTITPSAPINTNPANIVIRDEFTGAFGGANRHDVIASGDGGVGLQLHGIDDSFTFTTELTLTTGFAAPRKEAGIRINSPITGDALFLVNSDAGEIVTFGGGAPFALHGKNSDGNGYTPGDTILLGITMIAGGDGPGGIANTIEFFIDNGAGIVTTGPQLWDNLELGPTSYTVGVYVQGGTDASGDFVNGNFANTTYTAIPEPASALLMSFGLASIVGLRRRR